MKLFGVKLLKEDFSKLTNSISISETIQFILDLYMYLVNCDHDYTIGNCVLIVTEYTIT